MGLLLLRVSISLHSHKTCAYILQCGMGLTIAIIEFAIWPYLTSMQLLNHAIKTSPTVLIIITVA